MSLPHRAMIFVDGENLTFRFQAMVAKDRKPRPNVCHMQDVLVWSPQITKSTLWNLSRVSYYATNQAAEDTIQKLKEQIAKIRYEYQMSTLGHGIGDAHLIPCIFKKSSKEQKTKSVDMNICIDVLRSVYANQTDVIFLMTGDGDYLPLIEEVMRQGKIVYVGAFSSGLKKELQTVPDEFIDLDAYFFE